MHECLCSVCRNLKSVISENGEVEEFKCEFGFPSARCEECSDEFCDENCSHFEEDVEDIVENVKCVKCGKVLNKVLQDDVEGDIFCIDCYLNNTGR